MWLELRYDRRAVTSLEYGLIAVAILLACAGAFAGLGTSLRAKMIIVHGLFPD